MGYIGVITRTNHLLTSWDIQEPAILRNNSDSGKSEIWNLDFLLLEDRVFIPCISTTKPRDAIGRNMMIRKTQPDTWQGTNVPNPKRPCVSVVLTKQRQTKNGRDVYFRGIYTHFLVFN